MKLLIQVTVSHFKKDKYTPDVTLCGCFREISTLNYIGLQQRTGKKLSHKTMIIVNVSNNHAIRPQFSLSRWPCE